MTMTDIESDSISSSNNNSNNNNNNNKSEQQATTAELLTSASVSISSGVQLTTFSLNTPTWFLIITFIENDYLLFYN